MRLSSLPVLTRKNSLVKKGDVRRKLLSCVALGTLALSLAANHKARAATNTAETFTATAASASLATGTNYSPAGVPTVATDVVFTTTSSTTPTLSGTTLTVGSLDDLRTGATITITNTSTTTASTLTLGGTGDLGDGVSGANSADLIYEAAGAGTVLSLNGGTGTNIKGLNIVLGQSGSFDVGTGSVLNLGTAGTTGSTLTLGGFTLTDSGAGTVNIGSVIVDGTGAAGVLNVGAGVTTLTGANTFTGGVNLNGGTLNVGSNAALGTGTLAVAGGTTLNTNSTTARVITNALALNGSFTFTGTGALTQGTGAITLGGAVDITTTASTLTLGGVIGDGGSNYTLSKDGAGALTLAGANTFGGGVTLNAGTLNVNNATALGTGTLTIGGGTTLNNTSGAAVTESNNNAQTINGSFTFTGTNSLNLGTGAVTLGATPTITTSASTLTEGGNISGAFGITKAGAGALELAGANTFTGAIGLNGGTLVLSGTNTSSGITTFVSGATLQLVATAANTTGGTSSAFGSGNGGTAPTLVTGLNGATFALRADSSTTFTTPTITGNTGGDTITFNVNNVAAVTGSGPQNNTLAISGTFNNGTGSDHANTLVVNSSNGYALTLPTVATEGATTALQTITVNSGATLNIGTLTQQSVSKGISNLVINGLGTTNVAALTSLSGSSDTITLTNGTLNLNGTNVLLGATGSGNGGKVTLTSGTLNLNNAGALNTSNTQKANLTINGGTLDNTSGAAVTLAQAVTQSIGGDFTFTGTNSLNMGTGAVTLTATPTITVGANTLTEGGVISGTGFGITKAGAGTLALAGANTFTGAITINGGTVLVTTSNALGAPVAASTTGTPATGPAPLTLGGGTFARGGTNGPVSLGNGNSGTVGIGMLTLTASSTIDFGTTGSGTLSLASFAPGGFTLNVLNDNNTSGAAGTEGSTDRLIFNQDQTANLASIEFNGVFDATQIALGGGEFEIVAAVPEPSTWVAGLLSLGTLAFGFNKRRRAVKGNALTSPAA